MPPGSSPVRDDALVERLARAHHATLLEHQCGGGTAWYELAERTREGRRAAIRHVLDILEATSPAARPPAIPRQRAAAWIPPVCPECFTAGVPCAHAPQDPTT